MAKATPVTEQKNAEAPAPAVEIKMAPAAQAPAKVDPAELEAIMAEAKAAKKTAMIVGNAVRVDH